MGLLTGSKKKKLQKKYERMLKEAQLAQRAGNIRKFAEIDGETARILEAIHRMDD